MLLRFNYLVDSAIYLFETWPIQAGRMCLQFGCSEERVTSLSVEVQLEDDSSLPKIQQLNQGKIRAHLNIPPIPYREEVRGYLRRVQNLLSVMGRIQVDFSSEKIEWIPETDEEREKLHLYSFSAKTDRSPRELSDLTFDFIASIAYSAYSGNDFEVPLSFIRRGRRDLENSNYINAFYNFFFFLETKFFPGYSNPRSVISKILSSQPVMDALSVTRKDLTGATQRARLVNLLSMTDEDLVRHIVTTRGNLHHHSRHGPASWHPEKEEAYEAEAIVLAAVSGRIASNEAIEFIFQAEGKAEFLEECERQGAIVSLEVLFHEISSTGEETQQPVRVRIPGKSPHLALLERAHKEARRLIGLGSCNIRSYEIMESKSGSKLAEYKLNRDYFV